MRRARFLLPLLGKNKFTQNFIKRTPAIFSQNFQTSAQLSVTKKLLKLAQGITFFDVGHAKWIACVDSRMIPHGAVLGGEENDGTRLYVIRAHQGHALYPGKLNVKTNKAYIGCKGKEIQKSTFEVLVARHDAVKWVAFTGDDEFKHAVDGGISEDRETLFIGRAVINDDLTIGYISPSQDACFVPYQGEEVACPVYEVLVYNKEKFAVHKSINYL